MGLSEYFTVTAANCRTKKYVLLAESDDLETPDEIFQISLILGRNGVK